MMCAVICRYKYERLRFDRQLFNADRHHSAAHKTQFLYFGVNCLYISQTTLVFFIQLLNYLFIFM